MSICVHVVGAIAVSLCRFGRSKFLFLNEVLYCKSMINLRHEFFFGGRAWFFVVGKADVGAPKGQLVRFGDARKHAARLHNIASFAPSSFYPNLCTAAPNHAKRLFVKRPLR